MHNLYNDTDISNTPSNIILKLKDTGNLTDEEWKVVLANWENELDPSFLYACGDSVCSRYYGDSVYIRGLIEFTTSAKMTASIVASEGTTDISQDTDLLRNR